MRVLLDTRVLLWWLTDDPRLSTTARDVIGALGKLQTPTDLDAELDAAGFSELAVSVADAVEAGALP